MSVVGDSFAPLIWKSSPDFLRRGFFRFLFLKGTKSMFVLKSRILVAACWASGLDQYPCLILGESSFDFSEDSIYSMLLSCLVLGFCACPQACQRRDWKLRQEQFHDRSEVPSSSARQDKRYNAANPSQGWPSSTERLTYSTKSLILSGLDQKYFTTFPCIIYRPLVHPAKDNMEMGLSACVEVFCSLPNTLKVSRALSALQLPFQPTLHEKERQALTEITAQSGWAVSLCDRWTKTSACGAHQLLSEDREEVIQSVLCQQPFRIATLGLCNVLLANTLSAPMRLSFVDHWCAYNQNLDYSLSDLSDIRPCPVFSLFSASTTQQNHVIQSTHAVFSPQAVLRLFTQPNINLA